MKQARQGPVHVAPPPESSQRNTPSPVLGSLPILTESFCLLLSQLARHTDNFQPRRQLIDGNKRKKGFRDGLELAIGLLLLPALGGEHKEEAAGTL